MSFEKTVSALTCSIASQRCGSIASAVTLERVVSFVLAQHGRMPDYLRFPLKMLTLGFSISTVFTTGRRFHHLSQQQQWRHVLRWKNSWFGPCRDLVKFFESLVIFGYYAG